ncbi:hypothetical protein B0H14DRAFT_2686443 [Mycena olivaceomarginata]|nr:hypothetical protein B0H14DRAFT_2686443 [Mycena olivaceomarginata]
MKATVAFLLVPLFSSSTLASFIVHPLTKTALTCEPVLLHWEGGKREILAATDGSFLENLGTHTTTTFSWLANVEAGTSVFLQVTDSTGAVETGEAFTVQSGTNSDCAIIQNNLVASPSSSTTDNGSSSSSSASKSTPSSSTSSSSQASKLNTAAGTSPTATATSLSIQYTSAAPSPSPSPSPSSPLSAAAAPGASHISRVGMAFAILIPLLVLVIVGFLLLCRRRRRKEALSALEAQPPSPHCAAAASAFNAGAQNATQGPATREVVSEPPPPALRSTLNIDITPPSLTTTVPGPGPETSGTPATGSLSALSDAKSLLASAGPSSSKYVETLRSRIDALMAENALLAEMASSPHGESPPPAYGLN